MKVAIPEHQGRVAPVFDTCRRILIFSQEAEGEEPLAREDWSATGRHGRPGRLKQLGVEILLCGGISGWMEDQVHVQGIRTMPWLAGEVSEILEAFRHGTISESRYAMPGCARRKRLCGQRSPQGSKGRGAGTGRRRKGRPANDTVAGRQGGSRT